MIVYLIDYHYGIRCNDVDTIRYPTDGWSGNLSTKMLKCHEQQFGPPSTSDFYELYKLQDTQEMVVLKSITVDHINKTLQTFMLGSECSQVKHTFETYNDLNIRIEEFDSKDICCGVRDQKFLSICFNISTGYLIEGVWRSNK